MTETMREEMVRSLLVVMFILLMFPEDGDDGARDGTIITSSDF